jgi:hypothetical protein
MLLIQLKIPRENLPLRDLVTSALSEAINRICRELLQN